MPLFAYSHGESRGANQLFPIELVPTISSGKKWLAYNGDRWTEFIRSEPILLLDLESKFQHHRSPRIGSLYLGGR